MAIWPAAKNHWQLRAKRRPESDSNHLHRLHGILKGILEELELDREDGNAVHDLAIISLLVVDQTTFFLGDVRLESHSGSHWSKIAGGRSAINSIWATPIQTIPALVNTSRSFRSRSDKGRNPMTLHFADAELNAVDTSDAQEGAIRRVSTEVGTIL